MAGYDVFFKESVWRELRKVPKNYLTKILSRIEKLKDNPKLIWQLVKEKKWDKIALFRADKSPNLVGMTFDEIGRRLGKDPHDAVFDILLKEGDH